MKQDQDLTALNVSIPRSQKNWVERRVTKRGYGTVSEYVRHLIREDQKRAAQEDLEQKLLKGLDSGPGIEVTPQFWSKLKAQLVERHTKTKKKKGA